MESAPFDLVTGPPPSPEIPSDLVRVSFADVKVNKVYYIRFHVSPEHSIWLLAKVTDKGERVVFDSSWSFSSGTDERPSVWNRYIRTEVTPAQVDTDILAGAGSFHYHFYVPIAVPAPNLGFKKAPSGSNKRKARRRSSRSRSHRRSTRRNRRK
jgi:hypothetical protein